MKKKTTYFVVLSFLIALFFNCSGPIKKKADLSIPPKYVKSEPVFKKEGELLFKNKDGKVLTTLDIEKAENENERAQGLMFRTHMDMNQGMLFLFEKETRQAFWMKNTSISLDIIFVNAQKEIVHIAKNTKPYSTESIPSFEYAQFVIEVNNGYCNLNNIMVGDRIDF